MTIWTQFELTLVAIARNLRRLVKLAAEPLRALRESQVALSCAAGAGSRALGLPRAEIMG
jgi:hypothetical protein